jgi:ribosomal protein L37AE/L43A
MAADDGRPVCPFCDEPMDRVDGGLLMCEPCGTDAVDGDNPQQFPTPKKVYA